VYTGLFEQNGLGRQLGYTRTSSQSAELQMDALVAARVRNATFLLT
jgi:hypothetical protein